MRIVNLICFFFFHVIIHAQSIEIRVDWDGSELLEMGKKYYEIPYSKNFDNNFSYGNHYKIVQQWTDDNLIDPKSIKISDLKYSDINVNDYSGLERLKFEDELKFHFQSSISKNKIFSFLELSPVINIDGKYKKVDGFKIEFKYSKSNKSTKNSIQPSKMRNGQWYQFYVQETGIHRIDKDFLEDLGVDLNEINPKKIKIFGQGGYMLDLINHEEYKLDPIENSIKVFGEDDGEFNSNDFILFYATGPKGPNSQSDTNLNLYEDRVKYFLSVGSEDGLRIDNFEEPIGQSTHIIDYYTNYKFIETDNYNLAKIGRRWFGERFDFENVKDFQFNFENLKTDMPVRLKIYAAATSEISTSMSVDVNNSPLTNLFFGSIGDPILAVADNYSSDIFLNASETNIRLTYNNNGNPSSSAYLDYISLEGTSDLIFNNGQLIFYNNDIDYLDQIVSYQISNSQDINNIWDISNISDIKEITPQNQNIFSFKSVFLPSNKFIAFDDNEFLIPSIGDFPEIVNQNLKEDIFSNSFGEIMPVDYLIIARSDMLNQAERLANINREVYGLNVKVVEIQKIYNEFNSGNQDIAALRNFVRYVYNNEINNSALKYLCLFGDASYDYKDRIPNNTNIIPSWHSLNSYSLSSSFISDDFYGMMDLGEGLMTNSDKLDIAVGRILADSNERAIDLVDKIESYYNQESYGDWRNKLMVISDDVDEPWENVIQTTSNNIADIISENKPFFNTKKIISDAYNQETSSGGERYPEVKSQIINGMKQGALVVNYFGHGGEDGLARERIFDKIDAAEITNSNKLNCFVSVTCEFTKFDNPNRETAGEFLYWNKNGGSVALITTTRQIFVSVGVNFNLTLENYLFSLNSETYTSMAEALRLTKIDSAISSSDQRRLVFFIGDPAMKLAIPSPDIRITQINDVAIENFESNIRGLDLVNIKGGVFGGDGILLDSYNGELTATVFDKEIQRSTLANDGTTNSFDDPIILNFETLGEILFRGKSSISDGQFEFNFVVPRDVGMNIDNGKFSFYSKESNNLQDNNGHNLTILIGGVNEDAEDDNIGPEINLFMNDESFITGGITNENPNLIVKLFDENGINTSSGVGHDIVAILDSNEADTYRLNEYYEANLDDYQNGSINFPLNDLSPGPHTLSLKAWDVYNNSSESEIDFVVFDENQDLVIDNVLNYPNPFFNYTEFWFNHNSSSSLNVTIQIFTISGRLVKTINGLTSTALNDSFSRDFSWDGRDDFGDKLAKGVYIYKISLRSEILNKSVSKTEKLVIL